MNKKNKGHEDIFRYNCTLKRKKNSKKKEREDFKNDLTLLFTEFGKFRSYLQAQIMREKKSNTTVLDLDG